jgi:hypothetical protein
MKKAMTLTIDLNELAAGALESEMHLLRIEKRLPQRRRFLGIVPPFLPPKFDYHIHSVRVKHEYVKGTEAVTETPPLFKLAYVGAGTHKGDADGEVLSGISVESVSYGFDLSLNTLAISDVGEQGAEGVTLNVAILLQEYEGGETVAEAEIHLDVQFVRENTPPKPVLKLTTPKLQFDAGLRKIGNVEIDNEARFALSERVEYRLSASRNQGVFPVMLGTPVLLSLGQGGFRPEQPRDDQIEPDRSVRTKIIPPQTKCVVPVLVDMHGADNPITDLDEEIRLIVERWAGDHQAGDSIDLTDVFHVQRDESVTRLVVELDAGTERAVLDEGETTYLIRVPRTWHDPDKANNGPVKRASTECFSVVLRNAARFGDNAVFIGHLQFSQELSGAELNTNDGLLRLEHSPLDRGALVLPDNKTDIGDEFLEINAVYEHEDIENITVEDERADGTATISFVAANGPRDLAEGDIRRLLDSEGRQWTVNVKYELEQWPGSNWLAVDFGTSAVVVAHGNDLTRAPIIDIWTAFHDKTETVNHKPSGEAPFLTSVTALNAARSLDAEYSQSFVQLARDETAINHDDSIYRLPYLKSLIGSDYLPLSGEQQNWTYKTKNSPEDHRASKLETSKVLEIVYRQLLELGVKPALASEGETRKIVATIPNTFTLRHRGLLQELMTSLGYNPNYIRFLSESDAVAVYYYLHRADLVGSGPTPDRERVLVYDMGAGTLDLTYFEIRNDVHGRTIDILGRVGKNTAGNYLDFLIAETLVEELWKGKHDEIAENADVILCDIGEFSKKMESRQGELADMAANRRWLKSTVEHDIKPRIGVDDSCTLEITDEEVKKLFGSSEIEVPLGRLEASPRIETYLEENTDTVLQNLLSLSPESETQYVDTVVFAGRGSLFRPVRERFLKEMRAHNGGREIQVVEPKSADDSHRLKAMVAEGALAYAALCGDHEGSALSITGNNVKARYGVLYQDEPRHWRFHELLNPSVKPLRDTPTRQYGMSVFEYDTDKHDAHGDGGRSRNNIDLSVGTAVFVQTFASDPAVDWQTGLPQFTTRFFDLYQAEHGSVPHVRIVVDRHNRMIIEVGGDKHELSGTFLMNLRDDTLFRTSNWPN